MDFEQYSSEELLDELKKAKKQVALLEQDIYQYKVKEEESNNIIDSLQNRIGMIESVFQTIPAGIMIVDENRNITEINKVLENMVMKNEDRIVGKKGGDGLGCYNSLTLTECGTGRICETCTLKNSVEYVLNTGKSLFNIEVNPVLLINDEIKKPWLKLNILRTIINKEKYAVLIIEDIYNEKRNRQLKDKIKVNEEQMNELKEYDKLKNEFLANISHEFKTPLNIILVAIQLLEMMNLQSINATDNISEQKYIKMMKQNCYRLLKLIDNLIDIGKIGSGFFNMNFRNENIVPLIEEITLSTVEFAKGKEIKLIFDTQIEEKVIACDVEKIERVMLNLLSNAIKYTKEKGTIKVNIYEKDKKILISVKDKGEGIPPNMLEEIFEIFRRVDSSFTRKNEGSGIGLYIVKSIIELHQGTISVKSKVGRGSEFIIELPIRLIDEVGNMRNEVAATYETNVERIHIEFSDIYK